MADELPFHSLTDEEVILIWDECQDDLNVEGQNLYFSLNSSSENPLYNDVDIGMTSELLSEYHHLDELPEYCVADTLKFVTHNIRFRPIMDITIVWSYIILTILSSLHS